MSSISIYSSTSREGEQAVSVQRPTRHSRPYWRRVFVDNPLHCYQTTTKKNIRKTQKPEQSRLPEQETLKKQLIIHSHHYSALTLLVGRQEMNPACKKWGDGGRWALVSPDGVALSRLVGVCLC